MTVLDWLFDDDVSSRRTGRSTAVAVALIRKALREPGHTVPYTDHVPGLAQRQVLSISRDTIEGLVQRDPMLSTHRQWDFQQRGFRVRPPADPMIWMPGAVLFEPPTLANRLREADEVRGRSRVAEALAQETHLDELLTQVRESEEPLPRRSVWERLQEDGVALTESD